MSVKSEPERMELKLQNENMKIIPPLFVRIGTYVITIFVIFLLLIALVIPYPENAKFRTTIVYLSGNKVFLVLYTPTRFRYQISDGQTARFVENISGKEYNFKIDATYVCFYRISAMDGKKNYSTCIEFTVDNNIKIFPPLWGYLYLKASDKSIAEYILKK